MSENNVSLTDDDAAIRALNVYRDFILEIFRRLDAVAESVAELKANPEHPNGWQNCDFCSLQFRKVCEYLTVAIVAAHHFDGHEVASLRKWSPKDILGDVARLSNHPQPVAVAKSFGTGPGGERQITPVARPIRSELISEIYGRCGDILHVGSLERILKGKMPGYEIEQLEIWLAGFRNLLANHVLFLPDIKTALVCLTNEEPTFFGLSSDGAAFDTSNLPDFEF